MSQNTGKILMFHRILPEEKIRQPNAYYERGTLISTAFFEKILMAIQQKGKVITFETYLNKLNARENLSNYYVLTFDDGYLDNYLYALPLLDKYKYKATFFPILKYCTSGGYAPLDAYYYLLDKSSASEKRRNNIINGEVKKAFIELNPSQQWDYIFSIFNHTGKGLADLNKLYMSVHELNELIKDEHEIGCHTWQHPILPRLNDKELEDEISLSLKALKSLGIKKPPVFAYPDGAFDRRIIDFLIAWDFPGACTVESHPLGSTTEAFALQRLFMHSGRNLAQL